MTAAPNQADLALPAHTGVLLLAPELFAVPPDPALLQASLTRANPHVRLLLRPAAATDLTLAETLARAGVAVEVLLPDGLDVPPTTLTSARMPPGSTTTDTDELALALSDALLAGDSPKDLPACPSCQEAQQTARPAREKLTPLAGSHHTVTRRLDPRRPGWHRALRRICGLYGAIRAGTMCVQLAGAGE